MTFKILPSERLYQHEWYPFPVWFLGWTCVIKALFWLFSTRGIYATETFPAVFPAKYFFFMIVFLVLSQGVFNLKKWARNLLAVACVADIIFYVMIPGFIPPGTYGVGPVIFELISGPIGDAAAFAFMFLSWSDFGNEEQF